MAEPERLSGYLYDGRSALRHAATILVDDDAVEIVETGERIGFDYLRATGDARFPSYARVDRDGWRLVIDIPEGPTLPARLPTQERHGWLLDRFGVRTVLAVATLLAVVSLYAFGVGTTLLARIVPMRWEIAAGDALAGPEIGGACKAAAGQAAMGRLMTELAATDVRVEVADLPIVNAVALPGRRVIVFRGLIDQAGSPDEVAALLAHEIGHVERRDPLITLLRGFGISLLLGGMDGGAAMQTLLANRYSRDAERGADSYGMDRLLHAGISPRAGADFFDRMARSDPQNESAALLEKFLSTHPLSAERRQAFLTTARGMHGRPALTAADWHALRTICTG